MLARVSLLPLRAAARAAAAAAATLVLAGCGSASQPSPPAGVDLLRVPTPSPRAEDFVAAVDNPWLALEPGTSVELRSADAGAVTLSVGEETVPVAGLAATPVRRTGPGLDPQTDLFAQDVDGNVWWLGRQGVWEAGVDGAQAGLVMPATPRVGDGWRMALLPGVVEDLAEVVTLGEPLELDGEEVTDTVVVEVTDPVTGEVRRRTYVRGVGLVLDRAVISGGAPDPLGTLVRAELRPSGY